MYPVKCWGDLATAGVFYIMPVDGERVAKKFFIIYLTGFQAGTSLNKTCCGMFIHSF